MISNLNYKSSLDYYLDAHRLENLELEVGLVELELEVEEDVEDVEGVEGLELGFDVKKELDLADAEKNSFENEAEHEYLKEYDENKLHPQSLVVLARLQKLKKC